MSDEQGTLFGADEGALLPAGPARRGGMLVDGARTLEEGDQIVVEGYRGVVSTIRQVLREHEGRPGVFYRLRRYDRERRRMRWVVVPWLEVICVVARGLGSARKQTGKAAKAKSRSAGKGKPMSARTPRGRRRDVTAEMDSLFDEMG